MTTDIQTAALLANFSELTYHPDGTPPAGWALIPGGAVEEGSFAAYAYRNTTTNQIVIAYAGTNGLGDWIGANLPILLGGAGNQLTPAAKFAARIQAENEGMNILVTGHSLGGALAQAMSSMFGFDGATMDPLAAAKILDSQAYKDVALALTGDTANGQRGQHHITF